MNCVLSKIVKHSSHTSRHTCQWFLPQISTSGPVERCIITHGHTGLKSLFTAWSSTKIFVLDTHMTHKALTYPSVWSLFVLFQALNNVMQRGTWVCVCVCVAGGLSYQLQNILPPLFPFHVSQHVLELSAAAFVCCLAIDRWPLGCFLLSSALTDSCLRLLTAHRGCLCLLRNAWDT